jgi:hypothetical protein
MAKIAKFTVDELQDFRIPVAIFKENCSAIYKSRPYLKDRILKAIGIDP